jgi:hypothetical protein
MNPSPAGPGAAEEIELADAESIGDLATYVGRARRLDPDGAARLVAAGGVLAVYVSPVHGAPGPTVLGLRTAALNDRLATLDLTVPLAALGDRLAVKETTTRLSVPPMRAVDAGWAGVSAPRSGWDLVTGLDPADLVAAARSGVEEIARAVPDAVGSHVVAQVRASVWGRDLPTLPGAPAGIAFAADALGFLDPQEAVAVRRAGPWWRLSTARGHVLARAALL